MPSISVVDLSIQFRVYGANSRSLKKQIVRQATGGLVSRGSDDAVSIQALDNLSLEFRHGDRVGLVGSNGSGKSTLLKVLAGIYSPTSGSVKTIGSVGALLDPNAGMDAESTGIENIYLRGNLLGLSRSQIEAQLADIAEFTELGDFLDLPIRTYSTGMVARLAFAISTTIHPGILLIDEAIGTGDAHFLERLQKRLDSFISRAGVMVMASHDPSLLRRFCREKVELSMGRLVSRSPLV